MPDEKPPGPSGQDYLRLGQDGDTVRGHGQERPAHNYEFSPGARGARTTPGFGFRFRGSLSDPPPPAYGDHATTQSSILGGEVTASPDRMSSPPPYSPGGSQQIAEATNSLLPERGQSAPSASRPTGGNGSGTGNRPARTM